MFFQHQSRNHTDWPPSAVPLLKSSSPLPHSQLTTKIGLFIFDHYYIFFKIFWDMGGDDCWVFRDVIYWFIESSSLEIINGLSTGCEAKLYPRSESLGLVQFYLFFFFYCRIWSKRISDKAVNLRKVGGRWWEIWGQWGEYEREKKVWEILELRLCQRWNQFIIQSKKLLNVGLVWFSWACLRWEQANRFLNTSELASPSIPKPKTIICLLFSIENSGIQFFKNTDYDHAWFNWKKKKKF